MDQYSALMQEGFKLLVTMAVAYGGVKASMNGMRTDISEIKVDVRLIRDGQAEHGERLARLEATQTE